LRRSNPGPQHGACGHGSPRRQAAARDDGFNIRQLQQGTAKRIRAATITDFLEMNVNAMLAIGSAVFLAGAIFNHRLAFDDVRHRLPKVLQDPISATFAMDQFILESETVLPGHRRYAASLLCFAAMALCVAVLLFRNKNVPAALIISCMCAYGLSKTFKLWRRIKRLRRP
jgi:hypothetical protein